VRYVTLIKIKDVLSLENYGYKRKEASLEFKAFFLKVTAEC